MAKHSNETVTTPMGAGYGHGGAKPSGKVCTTHDATTGIPGLPARDVGPDSVPEVAFDENMNIPTRSK